MPPRALGDSRTPVARRPGGEGAVGSNAVWSVRSLAASRLPPPRRRAGGLSAAAGVVWHSGPRHRSCRRRARGVPTLRHASCKPPSTRRSVAKWPAAVRNTEDYVASTSIIRPSLVAQRAEPEVPCPPGGVPSIFDPSVVSSLCSRLLWPQHNLGFPTAAGQSRSGTPRARRQARRMPSLWHAACMASARPSPGPVARRRRPPPKARKVAHPASKRTLASMLAAAPRLRRGAERLASLAAERRPTAPPRRLALLAGRPPRPRHASPRRGR